MKMAGKGEAMGYPSTSDYYDAQLEDIGELFAFGVSEGRPYKLGLVMTCYDHGIGTAFRD